MQTSLDMLNSVSEVKGWDDRRIADALAVDTEDIERIRTRQGYFREQDASLLGEWLEHDALYVLACIRAERARHKGVKTVWARIARGAVAS